ncbi:MAG: efflux RND transporter periplasmic adaptor subunit [Phycisphaeraceae bacterium]|nr:efflux RND transporter periplasmic adaptor subunit [Phycisphaeraceae bacterium]MCB9848818.1 efflux RND transporter periplasmic adaptor subunit [Phycisphaeraceae bacterium]
MTSHAKMQSNLIHRLMGIPTFVSALLAITMSGGCSDRAEGGAHAQADVAAIVDDHNEGEGHDHGHAEAGGGEESHADEVIISAVSIESYGIRVESAQLWVLNPTVVAPARVAFNTEAMAHVGSLVRGRAVEVLVRQGDTVKAGDDLVIVESPELGEAQADFLQKRTAIQTAGPAVDLAKVAWERANGLYVQSQGISLTEVQRREAEYKAAVANVKAAEAAAMASENRLHLLGMKQDTVMSLATTGEIAPRYAIKAAIDGVVVQREVTLGELVSPDRESLMVLADLRTLWVLADVPESKLMGVFRGAKAWVTIGSTSGSTAATFEGEVDYITPLVDPMTRTAQVRILVPVTELSLKPGMFAQAEIVLTNHDGEDPIPVIAVPDEAIQTVEGGPAVFVPVPNEPNTFARRAVTVGKSVGGLVPILSGLVEGEQFVISGTFILKAELGKSTAAHEH